jgi:hypothetical protein
VNPATRMVEISMGNKKNQKEMTKSTITEETTSKVEKVKIMMRWTVEVMKVSS